MYIVEWVSAMSEFCYYNNDNRVSNAKSSWLSQKKEKGKENKKKIQGKILLPEVEFSRTIKSENSRKINVPELAWKNNEKTWNKILSSKVSVSRSSKTEHTWLRIDTRVRFFKFIFLKNSRDIKFVDTLKCLITLANRYHYALLTNHRSFVCAGIYLNRSQTPCTLCARYCYEFD